jgi:hypothetical protein
VEGGAAAVRFAPKRAKGEATEDGPYLETAAKPACGMLSFARGSMYRPGNEPGLYKALADDTH